MLSLILARNWIGTKMIKDYKLMKNDGHKLKLNLMDCISSHNFPTSDTRWRKWQSEWTRCFARTWLSTAKWKVQSLVLISSQCLKHIWLFSLVRPVSETTCLRADDMFTSHKSNRKWRRGRNLYYIKSMEWGTNSWSTLRLEWRRAREESWAQADTVQWRATFQIEKQFQILAT